jgi:single-stranded DNA-binding protein
MKGGRKMLNQVILVGRVSEELNSFMSDEGILLSRLVLNISTIEDKVEEGVDIPVLLQKEIASSVYEYIRTGMMIGIKAHIDVVDDCIRIMAEKLTFISSMEDNES